MTYGPTVRMGGDVDRHERPVVTGQGHRVRTGVLVPLQGMAVRRGFQLILFIQVLFCVLLQRLIDGLLAYHRMRQIVQNLTFI